MCRRSWVLTEFPLLPDLPRQKGYELEEKEDLDIIQHTVHIKLPQIKNYLYIHLFILKEVIDLQPPLFTMPVLRKILCELHLPYYWRLEQEVIRRSFSVGRVRT
jgi:hypothetical protein